MEKFCQKQVFTNKEYPKIIQQITPPLHSSKSNNLSKSLTCFTDPHLTIPSQINRRISFQQPAQLPYPSQWQPSVIDGPSPSNPHSKRPLSPQCLGPLSVLTRSLRKSCAAAAAQHSHLAVRRGLHLRVGGAAGRCSPPADSRLSAPVGASPFAPGPCGRLPVGHPFHPC